MEKKKLLLVAVSVGVFLVIVISASILIFTPNTGMYTAAVTPVLYGTPGASISPQERTPIISAPVVEAEEIRESQPAPVVNVYNAEQPITINVPKPSTAAVPDTPARVSGTTTQATAPASAAPATPRPAATTAVRPPAAPAQSAATASSKSAAQPAATASSRPAAARNVTSDYWVQTGAFSTKIRAEGVKETLAEKGITSIIENRDADGRTLYRVRVGPYTSENEANYWLALVKSIDGFADSQIRQTSSLR
jgi:DedD protein